MRDSCTSYVTLVLDGTGSFSFLSQVSFPRLKPPGGQILYEFTGASLSGPCWKYPAFVCWLFSLDLVRRRTWKIWVSKLPESHWLHFRFSARRSPSARPDSRQNVVVCNPRTTNLPNSQQVASTTCGAGFPSPSEFTAASCSVRSAADSSSSYSSVLHLNTALTLFIGLYCLCSVENRCRHKYFIVSGLISPCEMSSPHNAVSKSKNKKMKRYLHNYCHQSFTTSV